MAVSTVQRTIGGEAVDVYVITGTGDTEQVILAADLIPVDITYLNEADANSGADLAEKFGVTTLSNGVSATDFFAARIHLTIDLQATATRRNLLQNVGNTLVDLESRVTTLEP